VLWRPAHVDPPPALLVGPVPASAGDPLAGFRELELRPDPEFPELWQRPAEECGLADGQAVLYWFRVRSSLPGAPAGRVVYATDPLAWAVDRRFRAPVPSLPGGAASDLPAAVAGFRGGRLVPMDPGGEGADPPAHPGAARLAPNHRLVVYELPTRWVRPGQQDGRSVGVGTFRDVLALVEPAAAAPSFAGSAALAAGRAHLLELGVNALELLPAAESDDELAWGYGTSSFLAPDFDLGGGGPGRAPTANRDLLALVAALHARGLRFFADMVMAFSRGDAYREVNFLDFHVGWRFPGDPDRDPEQGDREGFGGDLLKYRYAVEGYDPLSGRKATVFPARAWMMVQAAHWLDHFGVDGLRLDSVPNTGSWDFLGELRGFVRRRWAGGARTLALPPAEAEARFLVVGEDAGVPVHRVREGRLDGLWNEHFKRLVRRLVLGQEEPGFSFEETVRRTVDCRLWGFGDGSEAVNYVTSHDVGGFGCERIFDYLVNNGVADGERRVKLAFACLLTSVGVPMILAGDEFADRMDLRVAEEGSPAKQVDPVNYDRLQDAWRRRVFETVARLVRLRTSSDALAGNDTAFLHFDRTGGRRVAVWRRGGDADPVVVVANFSDWGSDVSGPGAEYVVPGFPAAPAGSTWREVGQDRRVPTEWAGREPLYPWEAKVYALERA
jgi:glycosidase